MTDDMKLWAYRCERCSHHTLSVSRPYRCSGCRQKKPILAGFVLMTQIAPAPSPYSDFPDPVEFGI